MPRERYRVFIDCADVGTFDANRVPYFLRRKRAAIHAPAIHAFTKVDCDRPCQEGKWDFLEKINIYNDVADINKTCMRISSIKTDVNVGELKFRSSRSKCAVARVTTDSRLIMRLDFSVNLPRLPLKNTSK